MKTIIFKYHRNTNIQNKLIDKLAQSGVTITFEAEPEIIEPYFDESLMKRFNARAKRDRDLNYYGVSPLWFCAKVTVKFKGFEAVDYLGGCSYESYEQFTKGGDYYATMIGNCIDEINAEIKNHNDAVCRSFKIRKLLRLAAEVNYSVIPNAALNSY